MSQIKSQVNVLPVDLSQSSDYKPDSLNNDGAFSGNNTDNQVASEKFSKMVDKHIDKPQSGNSPLAKKAHGGNCFPKEKAEESFKETESTNEVSTETTLSDKEQQADLQATKAASAGGENEQAISLESENEINVQVNTEAHKETTEFISFLTTADKMLNDEVSLTEEELQLLNDKEKARILASKNADTLIMGNTNNKIDNSIPLNVTKLQITESDQINTENYSLLESDENIERVLSSKEANNLTKAEQAVLQNIEIKRNKGSLDNVKSDALISTKTSQIEPVIVGEESTVDLNELTTKDNSQKINANAHVDMIRNDKNPLDFKDKLSGSSKNNSVLADAINKVLADAKTVTSDSQKEKINSNSDSSLKSDLLSEQGLSALKPMNLNEKQLKGSELQTKILQQDLANQGQSQNIQFKELSEKPIDTIENIQLDAQRFQKLADTSTTEQNVKSEPKLAQQVTAFNNVVSSELHNILAASDQRADAKAIEHALDTIANKVTVENAIAKKADQASINETINIHRKDFANAVKDKVMIMMSNRLQQVEIRLDPPELGNMHIRVNLQAEHAAVNFVVQNQQAREAVEQQLTKLKEMLAESGVNIGEANVKQQDQTDKEEQQFAQDSNGSSSEQLHNEDDMQNISLPLNELVKGSARGVDFYA